MGGKGRGIFSDFRLGRVRVKDVNLGDQALTVCAVPVPSERACWKLARREEGKLVNNCGCEGCDICVHYKGHNSIGRRFHLRGTNFDDFIMLHLTSR